MNLMPYLPFDNDNVKSFFNLNRLPFLENYPLFKRNFDDSFFMPQFCIDMYEDTENIFISAELPGITEKDLDVVLSGNQLIIKGEKNKEEEIIKDNKHITERSFGSFQRYINLPFEPKDEDIDAKLKDGVLRLTIKKSNGGSEKLIKIAINR